MSSDLESKAPASRTQSKRFAPDTPQAVEGRPSPAIAGERAKLALALAIPSGCGCAALTAANLSIPVINGALALGTWQGIYLWERRQRSHTRQITAHFIGE